MGEKYIRQLLSFIRAFSLRYWVCHNWNSRMNEDLFDALTIADERISEKRRRDAETRLKH